MVTKKSLSEIEIEKLIAECETLVDDSYITTQDAKKLIVAGYKIL